MEVSLYDGCDLRGEPLLAKFVSSLPTLLHAQDESHDGVWSSDAPAVYQILIVAIVRERRVKVTGMYGYVDKLRTQGG